MRTGIGIGLLGLACAWASAAAGLTAAEKCEAAKLKVAGKYGFCRLKAEAKAVKTASPPDYSTCNQKYVDKWGPIESEAGGMCPSNSDLVPMNFFIAQHTSDVAAALAGGPLPYCPDDLTTCQSDLTTCQSDLAICQAEGPPATGQTTAYTADKNDGIGGAVAVPDDGTLQAGETLDYVDNGDGTVTDLNTGLMWEKKADDGGLHDKDNLYRWSGNGTQETIWDWVEDVNSEGGTGFAGYSDWRIPTKKELESIINAQVFLPAVGAAFNTGCVAACTPTTCSCTVSGDHWSSTTYAAGHTFAWVVLFGDGYVRTGNKTGTNLYVRAVRGGS